MILLKITFYFVIFTFIYHFATKKYLNPYKLIMVFGKKGSGKTTFLTKIAINGIASGRKIYSTVQIPGVEIIDPRQIGHRSFEPDSILLIDEVGLIWDNRNWKAFDPAVLEFFKYQRKYKLTCYLFSQSFDVDKKLRDLTDQMYLLRNRFRVFSVARRIDKRITVNRPGDDSQESSQQTGALIEDYSFASILLPGSLIFTFIPRWVIFFDTTEGIKTLDPVDSKVIPLSGAQYACIKKWGYRKYVAKTSLLNAKSKIFSLASKIARTRRKTS